MSMTRNQKKRRDRLTLAYHIVVIIAVVIDVTFLWYHFMKYEAEHVEPVKPNIVGQQKAEIIPALLPEVSVTDQHIVEVAPEEEKELRPTYENTCAFDYEYVLRVVAAECRGEPYEGQMAVAQCILNTAWERSMTPEEVVKEKNQYASPVTNLEHIELVRDACDAVFFEGDGATEEPIRFFYSTKGGFVSKWHENNLEFVMQIGNHKFFKVKE